jgi:4,5-DOPA dioxygenase extradiol
MSLEAPSSNRPLIRSRSIYFVVLLVSLFVPIVYHTAQPYTNSIWQAAGTIQTAITATIMSESSPLESPSRTPVYFLGIGGPNFMENQSHPAFVKLTEIGLEITTKVKPKAVVVFSAHWQDSPNSVQINVDEKANIIYDFYGFPSHYYEYEYPNRGSSEVAEKVIEKLGAAGVEVQRVKRGLDHGVWVGFIAAFDPKKNPLNVPIVQVSLYDNENIEQHFRLGQALESLRDEDILIIGAGMAVHNLRDFRAVRATGETRPYVYTFDEALKEAATANPEERETRMLALMKRSDARKAHPTMEHILPIYVAAGAAGSDIGKRLWTFQELSLSWAQYRFGEVAAT